MDSLFGHAVPTGGFSLWDLRVQWWGVRGARQETRGDGGGGEGEGERKIVVV